LAVELKRFAAKSLFVIRQLQLGTKTMFSKELNIADIDRMGPIVEQLIQSGRLSDDETWAVDLSCRAACDLVQIRHSKIAKQFYSQPEIQNECAKTINEWINDNPDATPGTLTAICGQMHVASWGKDGKLGLYPLSDLGGSDT